MKNKLNRFKASLAVNAIQDKGDGLIEFSKPLVITDNTEQRNGTKYDIKTMDISEYDGVLTADHSMSIKDVIGETFGIAKAGNKVTVDGIRFAVEENALAGFAYNMMKGGFLRDFSIETYGPWPDDEGVYHDAKLLGLSVVVKGNNKSASLNEHANEYKQLVLNSIEEAKKKGLDTEEIEKEYLPLDKQIKNNNNDVDMKFVTIKNGKSFEVLLTYKNANGDEVKTPVAPGATVDVSEDQAKDVQDQVDTAVEPKKEEPKKEEKKTEAVDFAAIVKEAVAPLATQIKDLETKVFDNSAKEPEFKKANGREVKDMAYKQRHAKQIQYAWDALKGGDASAMLKLQEVNAFHLEQLQKENIVDNSITIADMGNFVISPELLRDIEGTRSNFTPLISKLDYRETLSLQMAWLSRSGDINMQEVEMCDDDADGNLKPISEYSATINTSNLHELAAVTPVCNAATRFLAVDLLGDVAQGYRTDYDRKRAQLFIARLQQSVNASGNRTTYRPTSDIAGLQSTVGLMAEMQEQVMGAVYIFNQKTYAELLKREIGAGANNTTGFGYFAKGEFGPLFLGSPFIVVPNELMPSLNSNETKTFVIEGANVTITDAIFYVDLSTFSGRTSGGLNYDLSTEAAYEVGGETRSAFQRNELVLRGSFFRGGAIRDNDKVVSMAAAGIS